MPLLISHNSRDRLADLVAEHLDHLHYLNDILELRIDSLNQVLTEHLLNNLLLPLYVYSLWRPPRSLKYQQVSGYLVHSLAPSPDKVSGL